MRIAIVGAGLAGLTCAAELQAREHQVTVYEAHAEVGGRTATRDTEAGGFDLGAQYFTARGAAFSKRLAAWREAGWIERWRPKLAILERGVASRRSAAARDVEAARGSDGTKGDASRWVAVPGMHSLCQQLAQGLDVRTSQQVVELQEEGKSWLLKIHADSVPVAATAGPFDAVILALPAAQAALLLQPVPALAQRAARAHLAPCWSLTLAFQQALPLDFDGAWVRSSRLAWIAREPSKPQRRVGERWVAHASPAWSVEHFHDEPERARSKLQKAFHEATGCAMQPLSSAVYRWRFAQADRLLAGSCLWQAKRRLGACGDWFAGELDDSAGRLEHAYLSGLALAETVGCCHLFPVSPALRTKPHSGSMVKKPF